MTTKPYVGTPGGATLTTNEQTIIGPVPPGEEWSVSLRAQNPNSGSANLTVHMGLNGAVVGSRADQTAFSAYTALDVERGLKLPAGGYLSAYASANGAMKVSWTIMRRAVPA